MLRKALFWLHLIAGVAAGLVIALLCLTGVALTFKPQILDWAQQEAWQVHPTQAPLPLDELLDRALTERPEPSPTQLVVSARPDRAHFLRTGRGIGFWVDPYTGELRDQGADGWRAFFRTNESLHRWLGAEGDARDTGRSITGAANAAFFVLAVSGLFLWLPRRWTQQAVRAVLWFRRGLTGKARDFNWHHVFGFWALPVLLVLTFSGMAISYPSVTRFVYTVAGEEPPEGRGRQPVAVIPVDTPEDTELLSLDALLDLAAAAAPRWEELTLDLTTPPGHARTFAIRAQDRWPLFSSERIWLDPVDGETLRRETFEDSGPGRRARAWLRWLHTGEALGWPGQLAAGAASAAGLVLVYTGLALAWRRFWRWWRRR